MQFRSSTQIPRFTPLAAIAIWLLYSLALLDAIALRDWGTIKAGIGDLPLEGFSKVGFLGFLPYIGITAFVWNWPAMSKRGFLGMMALMGWMTILGPAAFVYMLRLQALNPIVEPNGTWIHYTAVNGSFLLLMIGLFALRAKTEAREPG